MALTTVKSDQIQSSVALAGSPTTTTQSASDNSTKIATTAYVETAVANLVASAPSALNTLDELAAALNDDASFSTTVTNSIATKLPLAGGTLTGALVGTKASFATASTTDYALRLTDNGVADYDVIFPDTSTYQLTTSTTSDKTFKLLNSGSGTFNLNVEGTATAPNIKATTEFQIFAGGTDIGAIFNSGGALTIQGTSTRDVSIGSDSVADAIFVEGTNGNVGIGDTTPGYKLEVNGTAHVVNTLTAGAIGIPSQGLTLNQGFGTGVPTLTTTGTVTNGRAGAILFNEYGDVNCAAIYSTDGAGGNANYGGLLLATYQSDIRFSTGGLSSTKMLIKSDGNVGIGTTNPTKKLHVIGDSNEGIHLKTGAQIAYTPTSSDFYSGLTLENLGSGHAYSIGYGQGGRLKFSYFDNSSTYEELAHMRPGGDFYPTGSVVMANGEGINFGATTNSGGNLGTELLNDYEDGTWTPILIAGTTNPTGGGALAPSGRYTKIGNRVWVTFYVGRSWTNNPSGIIYVSGLPYTISAITNGYYFPCVTYNVAFQTGTAGASPFLIPDTSGSGTTLALYTFTSGGAWTGLTWQTNASSSSGIYVSGAFSYQV